MLEVNLFEQPWCGFNIWEHVASFMELMLKHTKKLDKMLVLLDEGFLQFEIEDVVVPTFAHNKNVNVVLCATKLMASEEWWSIVVEVLRALLNVSF